MSSTDKGEVNKQLCSRKSGKYMLRSHSGIQTDSKMKVCKITSNQVHPLHTIHAPIYKRVGSYIHGITVLWVTIFAILRCLEASSTAVCRR